MIPTKGAIVPAAVGVDIGCGMCATMTDLKASDLSDSLVDHALATAGVECRKDHGVLDETPGA